MSDVRCRRCGKEGSVMDGGWIRLTAGPGSEVFSFCSHECQTGYHEADAIVRELAERGPLVDDDGATCLECGAGSGRFGSYDPTSHKPSCLWRRARALYPGGGERC